MICLLRAFRLGLLLCGMVLTAPGAVGETTVHPAPKPKTAPPAKPTPVVQPHGTAHPQKAPPKPAAAAPKATEPAPPPAEPPKATDSEPAKGSNTGLPLPRFAALGSNQVNLRIGPDLRYKIEWTYQRKDLPVQIVDEHENWRRIRDPDGTEGWVQRPLLTSRRSFLVLGEERALRRRAEDAADPIARLKPGVIGAIRKCEAESAWCEARVGDYRGWIKRSEIWGVTADEAVN